ncbi:MAG: phage holin [Akkermansia sp.]|nr:phage holin [Akkermansia sp.]MBR3387540.1 phage holin [Bacteroidales bacterium]
MNINWQVRIKNPTFWIGLIGTIGAPILAYLGISASDLTTWGSVGDAILATVTNPYLVGLVVLSVLSFLGVVVDPTTKGLGDSKQAMRYEEPHDDFGGFR